jgi:hypothetical protein
MRLKWYWTLLIILGIWEVVALIINSTRIAKYETALAEYEKVVNPEIDDNIGRPPSRKVFISPSAQIRLVLVFAHI